MLLWASKFGTAKIECNFEMGKYTPLGVPFILLLMVHVNQFDNALVFPFFQISVHNYIFKAYLKHSLNSKLLNFLQLSHFFLVPIRRKDKYF